METIQKRTEEGISSELALVQAAKKGDLEAFSELVKRYDRNIFRIAQHITHNEEDALDYILGVFLIVRDVLRDPEDIAVIPLHQLAKSFQIAFFGCLD